MVCLRLPEARSAKVPRGRLNALISRERGWREGRERQKRHYRVIRIMLGRRMNRRANFWHTNHGLHAIHFISFLHNVGIAMPARYDTFPFAF